MANPTRHPTPKPIDDFQGWLAAWGQSSVWTELAVLLACVALAWFLVAALRRALRQSDASSIWFGKREVDGVLFPTLLLCLGYVARAVLDNYVDLMLFKVAIPVLVSLVAIRVGVKVLQAVFGPSRWMRLTEQTISWIAWMAVILWVSGLLPVMLNELDQIGWKIGGSTLTVRNMIEGTLTAGAVLIITLWISAGIESRLLRSATGAELSIRKAISNAARALLVFVGMIVALSAVGIDLTALSVLGGAMGVGIGLGLQKLAANYVSGFVILAERSMRIGDMVRVENFEGAITQINARYTVVRSNQGRESIVPNELLMTSRVENLSLADPNVLQTTVVTVAYDSDVDQVIRLLQSSALASERVLRDPEPAVAMTNFGADGLEFTVCYWISDLGLGTMSVRSTVNLAILAALRANNIEIPYPHRVVYHR